jgi:hypothetical protein
MNRDAKPAPLNPLPPRSRWSKNRVVFVSSVAFAFMSSGRRSKSNALKFSVIRSLWTDSNGDRRSLYEPSDNYLGNGLVVFSGDRKQQFVVEGVFTFSKGRPGLVLDHDVDKIVGRGGFEPPTFAV